MLHHLPCVGRHGSRVVSCGDPVLKHRTVAAAQGHDAAPPAEARDVSDFVGVDTYPDSKGRGDSGWAAPELTWEGAGGSRGHCLSLLRVICRYRERQQPRARHGTGAACSFIIQPLSWCRAVSRSRLMATGCLHAAMVWCTLAEGQRRRCVPRACAGVRPQMMEFSSAFMTVDRPPATETPMSSLACAAEARSAEIFCARHARHRLAGRVSMQTGLSYLELQCPETAKNKRRDQARM